jgi:hypothetical protein
LLQGAHGAPEKFALPDNDTLRKLDADGREIESKLNYDLKRASSFSPLESRGEKASDASLENTYWKLALLEGNTCRSGFPPAATRLDARVAVAARKRLGRL